MKNSKTPLPVCQASASITSWCWSCCCWSGQPSDATFSAVAALVAPIMP